ncbi:MAG TPA: LamG-like jellyroll fold domain-containing protein, partial [Chthoniobacteraceae bacterium]|nr:LamG-like jellyroll fold domain-containing protein [Chthoniobacteraceae bacterium]
ALRLEIARDLGRPQADWEAVNSEPFVTPERFGQWLQLATTFDGKTIRHYGNGRLIGSGASFTPPRLVVGAAELANWRGLTQRRLAAAMDEFVILSRALSPREIAELYEACRP